MPPLSESPILFALVKVFDKLQYAEAFRAGKRHMKTPRHFREYRDADGVLRGDPYEGFSGFVQPSAIKEIKVGGKVVRGDQLVGPAKIYPTELQTVNIFCMYSINTSGLGKGPHDSDPARMKQAFTLHSDCYGLGEHVAVINPGPFMERVQDAAAKQGLGLKADLVEYYDETKHEHFFAYDEVLFRKRERYAFLREYRVALFDSPNAGEPLNFDIGDLSDVVTLTTTEEFNRSLSFSYPDGTTLNLRSDASG